MPDEEPNYQFVSANGYEVNIYTANSLSERCVKATKNILQPFYLHQIPEETRLDTLSTPAEFNFSLGGEKFTLEIEGNKLSCDKHDKIVVCEVRLHIYDEDQLLIFSSTEFGSSSKLRFGRCSVIT
jgi:hypothetical protein